MTTLQSAEAAVERLGPQELERFLRWLSDHVGRTFGKLGDACPSAQELAERQNQRVCSGEAEPFVGVDRSGWPPAAREKAEAIIAAWRLQHGR